MDKKYFEKLKNHIINNFDDWKVDKYTIEHEDTGLEIWIANGFAFLYLRNPYEAQFSILQKIVLWRVINGMIKKKRKEQEEENYKEIYKLIDSL